MQCNVGNWCGPCAFGDQPVSFQCCTMTLQQADIGQSRMKCQHSSKLSNPYPATAESKKLVQELRANHTHDLACMNTGQPSLYMKQRFWENKSYARMIDFLARKTSFSSNGWLSFQQLCCRQGDFSDLLCSRVVGISAVLTNPPGWGEYLSPKEKLSL